ncbi:MAG TPA: alpha/beta hydrolase [Candidatus Dietzia intestinigallinarum]|nr:alpha/beta hydrolase [Candidatus Dietzia intestinigallinarum]
MIDLTVNGTVLSATEHGQGPLVVLIMGSGSPGSIWRANQVPALLDAGFRVVTYDQRGVNAGTDARAAHTESIPVRQLADDLAGLIEHFGGPAHLVGTSLGSRVALALALIRRDLVDRVVTMTGHARLDPVAERLARGEVELFDSGVEVPAAYSSAVTALQNLSPASLRDEAAARDWLDVLELSPGAVTSAERAHVAGLLELGDRRAAYSGVTTPVLVLSFTDDVMVPPHLGRELAELLPTAEYVEVSDAGHYGYLERPGQTNRHVIEFLTRSR